MDQVFSQDPKLPLYILFIDFKKAYDTIRTDKVIPRSEVSQNIKEISKLENDFKGHLVRNHNNPADIK